MRFITYLQHDEEHAGVLYPDQDYILPFSAELQLLGEAKLPASLQAFIEAGDWAIARVRELIAAADKNSFNFLPVQSVKLLAPIPRPRKNIFCVGKNYAEHAFEFEKTRDPNMALPEHPVIFSKPPTSVIGQDEIIKSHKDITSQIDYEAEVAVVIGKKASKVKKEDAYNYVFGYTILNDVTARDLQVRHKQWLMGKGPDTFGPMGPCITHKSAIPNPHDLKLKSYVNGELRQNGYTGDMIFDIPTLIAEITSVITLEPGDIIATGTPAGVGVGFNPPKFLKSGDIVEVELDSVGKLKNTVE